MREENFLELPTKLGCWVGDFPSSYYWLPLGAHHKFVAVWDEVKGRMRKGQEIRRRQHITKGRRVTLTKSTLASMSLYLMWIHREENSFGEVGYKVFGQGQGWAWYKVFIFKQIPSWQIDVEVCN